MKLISRRFSKLSASAEVKREGNELHKHWPHQRLRIYTHAYTVHLVVEVFRISFISCTVHTYVILLHLTYSTVQHVPTVIPTYSRYLIS